MKILQLCPLWYPIGRDACGGIETLLATLVDALERQGGHSTLLATGDSNCAVPVIPVVDRNLVAAMADGEAAEYELYQQHQLALAASIAGEFDVVHSHAGPAAFVLSTPGVLDVPVIHTLHSQVTPDLAWYVSRHPDLLLTAVSRSQTSALAGAAGRCTVVPNGIDPTAFAMGEGGEGLVFLGRIESEKGADIAIDVARSSGRALDLAGPITDEAFFDRAIRPRLNGDVRYLGVASHEQKVELLGRSACVLMPSRWNEPFGIVAIESMACGTPVVGLAHGALPEIVEQGITGFTTPDESSLPDLVARAAALDRGQVREAFEAQYAIDAVAAAYLDVYRRAR